MRRDISKQYYFDPSFAALKVPLKDVFFSHAYANLLEPVSREFYSKKFSMRNRIHENPVLKNRIEFKELCEETNGTRTVAEVTLKSGGKIPLHYHFEFSEYYEVLEGELKMQVGKEIKTLYKGDYLLIPVKTVHRYFNESGSDVKFKVVIQPGNIGYQLLVSVLNGLARDRKVNKKGLPTNWLIRGYLSVASGSNVPGILSWLQPILNWLYKIAIKRGMDKQLLSEYYTHSALAKV